MSFDPTHTVRWSLKLLQEYHRANLGKTNGRKTRAVANGSFLHLEGLRLIVMGLLEAMVRVGLLWLYEMRRVRLLGHML